MSPCPTCHCPYYGRAAVTSPQAARNAEIRQAAASGQSLRELARAYRLTYQRIGQILKNEQVRVVHPMEHLLSTRARTALAVHGIFTVEDLAASTVEAPALFHPRVCGHKTVHEILTLREAVRAGSLAWCTSAGVEMSTRIRLR